MGLGCRGAYQDSCSPPACGPGVAPSEGRGEGMGSWPSRMRVLVEAAHNSDALPYRRQQTNLTFFCRHLHGNGETHVRPARSASPRTARQKIGRPSAATTRRAQTVDAGRPGRQYFQPRDTGQKSHQVQRLGTGRREDCLKHHLVARRTTTSFVLTSRGHRRSRPGEKGGLRQRCNPAFQQRAHQAGPRRGVHIFPLIRRQPIQQQTGLAGTSALSATEKYLAGSPDRKSEQDQLSLTLVGEDLVAELLCHVGHHLRGRVDALQTDCSARL